MNYLKAYIGRGTGIQTCISSSCVDCVSMYAFSGLGMLFTETTQANTNSTKIKSADVAYLFSLDSLTKHSSMAEQVRLVQLNMYVRECDVRVVANNKCASL